MKIMRPWLVVMFDKDHHTERFLVQAENTVDALHIAAKALEPPSFIPTFQPCEVHLQLLTTEEFHQALDMARRP